MAVQIPLAGATRYDFQRAMPLVYPDQHWEGWRVQVHDANGALILEDVPGELDIEGALSALKTLNWVVARWQPYHHVRAWHGDSRPVTRIDFLLTPQGWRVRKWLGGWMASTDPVHDHVKARAWNPQVAWQWLKTYQAKDHGDLDGWYIKRAGNFVRAWLGPVRPVRTAGQIVRMRDALHQYRVDLALMESEPWRNPQRPEWMPETLALTLDEIEQLDFAYLL